MRQVARPSPPPMEETPGGPDTPETSRKQRHGSSLVIGAPQLTPHAGMRPSSQATTCVPASLPRWPYLASDLLTGAAANRTADRQGRLRHGPQGHQPHHRRGRRREALRCDASEQGGDGHHYRAPSPLLLSGVLFGAGGGGPDQDTQPPQCVPLSRSRLAACVTNRSLLQTLCALLSS